VSLDVFFTAAGLAVLALALSSDPEAADAGSPATVGGVAGVPGASIGAWATAGATGMIPVSGPWTFAVGIRPVMTPMAASEAAVTETAAIVSRG
jgi:hypothetical protein